MRMLIAAFCLLLCGRALAAPAGEVPAAEKPSPQGRSIKTSQVSYALNEKAVAALQAKDWPHAESLLNQALAADPGNVTAAYNLASAYLTQRKFEPSLKLLKDYIAKAPQDAGLQARLGDTYFAMKKVKEALSAYEAAHRVDPKFLGVSGKLGTLYTMNNKFKEAEAALLQAVVEEPTNAELLHNLSSIFLANGKADQSAQTAKRALQVRPTSRTYITLGSAYEMLHDPKNALIAYERAADLGDKTRELKQKIDLLTKSTKARSVP